jgi:transketolase
MPQRTGFGPEELPEELAAELFELCRRARGDIVRMTTLAGSGHPGGSMSSLEVYMLLWSQANVDPERPLLPGRDRIVVSHGHTSPGVYSVLGRLGWFDLRDALVSFRLGGSPFEGHIERSVPGIELTSGNLGQGVSAACGMALADRVSGHRNHVWVISGDGEHDKGQICEARRFAAAYGLGRLTVVIDLNHLQISGRIEDVMPVNMADEYRAAGWDVVHVNGHDLPGLYRALRPAEGADRPRVVLARTTMGRGVSFMEDDETWHGQALSFEKAAEALAELGLEDDLEELAELRSSWSSKGSSFHMPLPYSIMDHPGNPRTYAPDHQGDNRSAWGRALLDLAEANRDNLPLVFDCDLAGSVRTAEFGKRYPGHFFQSGIMEHHTASAAGGASIAGRVAFWADFGVFAADETFNQHRLNDINMTNLKVVATHCGLDVGQDGKTHHCIKYISLMGSLHHYATIIPADPNQTDRAIRYVATHPGNFFVAMGRSKTPVITDEEGRPFYGGDYRFVYGKHDLLRSGEDLAIVAMGNTCHRALEVRRILAESGISAAVYAVHCPLCLRPGLLAELRGFPLLASYEDHDADTGLGARLALAMSSEGGAPPLRRFGVVEYGFSGTPEELFRLQSLAPDQVAASLLETLR